MSQAACSSSPNLPYIAVASQQQQGHNDVGLEGELVEVRGCIMLKGASGPDETMTLLLFPQGTEVVERDGDLLIESDVGEVQLGENLLVGGGILSEQLIREMTQEPIPDACNADQYFSIGELERG
jgi:hypothetical protein